MDGDKCPECGFIGKTYEQNGQVYHGDTGFGRPCVWIKTEGKWFGRKK